MPSSGDEERQVVDGEDSGNRDGNGDRDRRGWRQTETEAVTETEKTAAHPAVGAVGRRLTAATNRPTLGDVERCVPPPATQPRATTTDSRQRQYLITGKLWWDGRQQA